VWKSNPPFDPRRTESPALKAGKVTGPLSPPRVILWDLVRVSKLLHGPGVSAGVSWFFDPGHCFMQIRDGEMRIAFRHHWNLRRGPRPRVRVPRPDQASSCADAAIPIRFWQYPRQSIFLRAPAYVVFDFSRKARHLVGVLTSHGV
jgi:hypothetical protein